MALGGRDNGSEPLEVARTRVLASRRSAGCGLQELDLDRSVGGPGQLRVAGQERQVELSGGLDEQRVVHPSIFRAARSAA